MESQNKNSPQYSAVIEEVHQLLDFSIRKFNTFNGEWHYHREEYELYLFLGGNAKCYVNQEIYQLVPGDIFIFSPFTPHKVEADYPVPYQRIVIHLTPDILEKVAFGQQRFVEHFQKFADRRHRMPHNQLMELSRLGNLLNDEIRSTPPPHHDNQIMIYGYYSLILGKLLRYMDGTEFPTRAYPQLVQKALEYLDTNYTSITLSVQEIADSLNVSRSHLCHEFTRYYKDSLWNTIRNRRLEYARQLLLDGNTVSSACMQSGFSNYANFTKAFKLKYGVSPKQYALNQYHPVDQ